SVAKLVRERERPYGRNRRWRALNTERPGIDCWDDQRDALADCDAIGGTGVGGEIELYPIVETEQEQQVCRRVFVPAPLQPEQEREITAIARTIIAGLNLVGLIGIELFCTADGRIWVNEIAPRTHNSGHYSLDACTTSQFSMQLQAVAGRPLPSVHLLSPSAATINLLGYEQAQSDYAAEREKLATLPGAHVYWYGKSAARPGRKLGHVTLCLPLADLSLARAQASLAEAIWRRQAS
ncbi:MAG: ATP-grasp domain-containing protein, partial [Spirulinaceae cyanobacterium RM2_2_10]|nr:ATP-grasp domain-containing protein [Spirulinaceae cyanobacterium RM2_2_10]